MIWEQKEKIFSVIQKLAFLKGGQHLWTKFSQSFIDKNEEFLCLSERKFSELFKTHPTFVYSAHVVPSRACQTLTGVFFGTPCTFACCQPNVVIRAAFVVYYTSVHKPVDCASVHKTS